MKPIRVLHVVGRMDRGGIETFIMNLYRNIDRDKVQFDFLAHYGKEADYNEEIRRLGGKIYEMPVIKSTTKTNYQKVFTYIKALNQFFKEHNEYTVVHGHMTNTATIYMPIAKKHGVKCCIAHSHSSRGKKGLLGVATNILQFPVKRIADEHFACSKTAAKWLFNEKVVSENKVKIIPNAIDAEVYDFNEYIRNIYRKDLQLENKFVIGHVGAFRHEKNHNFLVDVFNEVLKMEPESVLVLVGDGALKSDIERKINRLNLTGKVRLLGLRSDVAKIMQAMDIFVMPSHFEGLPLVGVEAQAAGLPCILSTGVTNEVKITDRLEFLPLSVGEKIWAQKIVEYKNPNKRYSTKDEIVKAGYDIKEITNQLQDFYLKKYL